jgi:ABC-type hemin transport system ATPase subunit
MLMLEAWHLRLAVQLVNVVCCEEICCWLQGRMTLLLGPPQSGKSTVLKALSGRLHPAGLNIQGNVRAARLELHPAKFSA